MPSRAELRPLGEWALRAVLIAGLALALWRSWQPVSGVPRSTRVQLAGATAALREASRDPRVRALELDVDATPSRATLDWLRAARGAGVDVRWRGGPGALAVQVDRTREPESWARIVAVADTGARLALADSAGALDTLRVTVRGAMLEAPAVVGAVRAGVGAFAASAPVGDSPAPRAVLVLGRAGWEARFVATALQEAGWTVRARQPAAPGVVIADAGVLPVDTSRYAAVVALDSTARDLGPALARFVAQGGGVVLAGEGTVLPAIGALSPARAGARRPGRILLDADSVTRADLPLRPLTLVRGDALRLEGRDELVTVAVRRAGLGRVLGIGYDETWRWRMLGGAGGMAAHRAWWSRAVGLVAPEQGAAMATPDAAPRAALVDALGPPATAAFSAEPAGAPQRDPLPLLLLALLAVALLAETASRRFRGAR